MNVCYEALDLLVGFFYWFRFSQCTMQEHQTIPTNATVSKDSDKISISVIMAVYEIIFFFHFSNKSQKSRNSLPT